MKSLAKSSTWQLPMLVPNNLSASGEDAADANGQANPQPKDAQPADEKVGTEDASFLPGTSIGSRCSSSFDRPLEVRRGPPLCAALIMLLKFSLSHGN